ncbi:hypothetical protein FACS1894123_09120 [Bacteroidia bacterium]|nr:hypothetical protein FACS1894123_09120 [Bacteroidia bacterium]
MTAGIHVVYIYYYGNFDKFKINKNTTAIQLPSTTSGYVYAYGEGFLNVKGFSSNASVLIYNILGQKIADYKTINGHEQTWLSVKGIYVVKVLDNGVSSNYKRNKRFSPTRFQFVIRLYSRRININEILKFINICNLLLLAILIQ